MMLITDAYWTVQNASPGTQVFSSATGAFVVVGDAAFATWLTAGLYGARTDVVSAANNGSGLARLEIGSTQGLTTGSKWNVNGTGVYDANWVVTVIDATHVDLQGSTFSTTVTAGFLQGAQIIDTTISLLGVISGSALDNYLSGAVGWGFDIHNAASSFSLTNPLVSQYLINMSTTGQAVTFPQMNLPSSVPIGVPIFITNNGPNIYAVKNFAGTTLANVAQGEVLSVVNTSFGGTSGTLRFRMELLGQGGEFGLRSFQGGHGDVAKVVGTLLAWDSAGSDFSFTNAKFSPINPVAAGRLLTDAGVGVIPGWTTTLDTDGTLAANSDTSVASQKAIKTYADGLITAIRNGVSAAFDTLAEIATDLGLKLVKSANLSDVANVTTARANLGITAPALSNPVPTPGTGAFTTVSASMKSWAVGKAVYVQGQVVITTVGTAGGAIKVPLPSTPDAGGTPFSGSAFDATSGAVCISYVNAGDANLYIWLPAYVTAIAAAHTYYYSGMYSTA